MEYQHTGTIFFGTLGFLSSIATLTFFLVYVFSLKRKAALIEDLMSKTKTDKYQICAGVRLPFKKEVARRNSSLVVYLVNQEDEHINITHTPGLPYPFTANEMEGKKIIVVSNEEDCDTELEYDGDERPMYLDDFFYDDSDNETFKCHGYPNDDLAQAIQSVDGITVTLHRDAEVLDITHQNGYPYVFSPEDLRGDKITIVTGKNDVYEYYNNEVPGYLSKLFPELNLTKYQTEKISTLIDQKLSKHMDILFDRLALGDIGDEDEEDDVEEFRKSVMQPLECEDDCSEYSASDEEDEGNGECSGTACIVEDSTMPAEDSTETVEDQTQKCATTASEIETS